MPVLFREYENRIRTNDAACGTPNNPGGGPRRSGRPDQTNFFGELCERLPWIDRPPTEELEAFWRERFAGRVVKRNGTTTRSSGDMRSAGFRLGIVTNGRTQMQNAKAEHMGLTPLVDAVVISGICLCVKKLHPGIFQRRMRRISCESEAALFVGDNPLASDICWAGSNFGECAPAWLKLDAGLAARIPLPCRTYTILSLDELRTGARTLRVTPI